MRFTITSVLPVGAMTSVAVAQEFKYEPETAPRIEYDRFDDYTSISTPDVRISPEESLYGGEIVFSAFSVCGGRSTGCSPETVKIMVSRTGISWRLLDNHRWVFLIGDDRFECEETDHSGDVFDDGDIIEFVSCTIPANVAYSLAYAREAWARVGTLEYEVDYWSRKALRLMTQEAGITRSTLASR